MLGVIPVPVTPVRLISLPIANPCLSVVVTVILPPTYVTDVTAIVLVVDSTLPTLAATVANITPLETKLPADTFAEIDNKPVVLLYVAPVCVFAMFASLKTSCVSCPGKPILPDMLPDTLPDTLPDMLPETLPDTLPVRLPLKLVALKIPTLIFPAVKLPVKLILPPDILPLTLNPFNTPKDLILG